jgi:autoinducer-2 kinase
MATQNAYLILDIGTGNVRVAVTNTEGQLLGVERADVRYVKDELYPDALYFDPNELWAQIKLLTTTLLQKLPKVTIQAVTASSQREGIVLVDKEGRSLIGLSNHDHRGREWESDIDDPHGIYKLTGRYPTSLFSAMKLVGLRYRRGETFGQMAQVMSISDWAQFQVSGVAGYEHSQASETLLYDVEKMQWSEALCAAFDLDRTILPPLYTSGTVLGTILPPIAADWNLSPDVVVIVGGADTQLAIKSTQPSVEDIVLVSGTTTPIAKIVDEYIVDERERTWTNRHIEQGRFILEANAGVTGLNYQRLKEIFYPNETYAQMEKEVAEAMPSEVTASLGSLVAEEKHPITRGGFVFDVPVSQQLTRGAFVRAALWDIACAIKENLDCLCEVEEHRLDYLWACGGGFQSAVLRQYIADLTSKKIYVRPGFQQASVVGGALVCAEALGQSMTIDQSSVEITHPHQQPEAGRQYQQWKKVRKSFHPGQREEALT